MRKSNGFTLIELLVVIAIMYWKMDEDKYRVVFGDLHIETVNAGELIKIQALMLQSKAE